MANDSDGKWKYSIEDVGEDAENSEDGETPGTKAEKPADPEAVDRRIEPGSPSLENALFVVLGALLALGTVVHGLGLI
ncbi:DUF7312 domain-containing protein [Halalkalicoccus ordinarius]|uniref:DUF7312 domain-containing protein n=1 Tax=Halalkalicoccus ordinarius TaxID=3116651 RepID=UPI00300EAB2D